MRPNLTPNHNEYLGIVGKLAFTMLAQPLPTYCNITKAVREKIEGVKEGGRIQPGQGDLESVVFWAPEQAGLMLGTDPSYNKVAFCSSWGTGKTLLLREKARQAHL